MLTATVKSTGWSDLGFALGGAATATTGLVLLFDRPVVLSLLLLVLALAMLLRWHRRSDIAGLFVGASIGNLTELLSDAAGIWEHPARPVLGVAPLYIFACYPLLGLALPRMTAGILKRERPQSEGTTLRQASLIWALHLLLSCWFGLTNESEMIVCVACLTVTLARFHSAHDLTTAVAGGLLGMVWELPCTQFGVWRFPHPQILGLVPLWLPLAYSVFFVNLCRIIAAMGQPAAVGNLSLIWPQPAGSVAARN